MNVVVFVGPTLSADEVRSRVAADVRPPAVRGDVLRAARGRPRAIALIDGCFDGVPSVWHKEVLWAMAEGIHVFGAASMGALRAAELDSHGMEGVGAIFAAYKRGELLADDEVALAHGAAEDGYRAFSEPLVNVRATLRAARDAGVVPQAAVDALLAHAKALHYPDRSFTALLAHAERAGCPAGEVAALRAWLPAGRVDQKRADALALLERLAAEERAGWAPKRVAYAFAHTDAWEGLWRETDRSAAIADGAGEAAAAETYEGARTGAIARAMALELARRAALQVGPRNVAAAADEFRRERGLLEAEAFAAWLARNNLEGSEVESFFSREATIRRVFAEFAPDVMSHVVDHLRTTGEYPRLVEEIARARGAPVAPAPGAAATSDAEARTTIGDDGG